MAVSTPLYMNGIVYDGEAERRGLSGPLVQSAPGVPRSGVLGPAPSVTLSGSTVKVGPFNAAVSSGKGAYLVAVDSVTDAMGTVGVADATNPRLDRLVLEVLDPDNGITGGTRVGRLRLIPGVAAAIPGLPALPSLALHVGQVSVPKSGAGSPVLTVDPQFTVAAGGAVPVRSVADRNTMAAPAVGQRVTRLDDRFNTEIWTGSKWDWEPTPRGQLLYDAQTALSSPLLDLSVVRANTFTFKAGRRYRLSWVAEFYTDAADASNVTQIAIQKSNVLDANGAVTGLTMVKKATVSADKQWVTGFFNLAASYTPATDETVKVKLTAQRVGGTGSLFIVGEPNRAAEFLIEDLGAQV